jgi:hypothetical protein
MVNLSEQVDRLRSEVPPLGHDKAQDRLDETAGQDAT